MAVKTVQHSFRVQLSEEYSEKLAAYLLVMGMKKQAFMEKAIIRYLEENEK